jgi:probable H4MPT-linked C1 transfer pathway protein
MDIPMTRTTSAACVIMAWLALDIGGANLKGADGRGFAASRPFALWRAPERLAAELLEIIAAAPPSQGIAATMTGELADCYQTKAEGVRAIVDALVAAAEGRAVVVYSTEGAFLSPEHAKARPLGVAASNWHALAAFAARLVDDFPALLIDVGSTTTDVIPIDARGPAAVGRTDPERLLSGELAYMGVERTPVSAIVSSLPWRGHECPVASELFATAADAYIALGVMAEGPGNLDSADGRPRTAAMARVRLARMICADTTMFSAEDVLTSAAAIRDAQAKKIADAASRVIARMAVKPATIILSGHGEFLARAALSLLSWGGRAPGVLSLNEALGPVVSRCAPAHALAVLAMEQRAPGAEE